MTTTRHAPPSTILQELDRRADQFYVRRGKRISDLAGGSVLLVMLAPVIAVAAVVVAVTQGRPVLFQQRRIGKDGQEFRVFKFRTMGADRRVAHIPFQGEDRRCQHKTLADPRHTTIGRFLRRYSVDELPQLANVLRGDMSLVGPRPELSEVAQRAGIVDHARHSVRPGITGPWQISPDREGMLADNLRYDEDYVADISLKNDLSILLRTACAVVLGRGK